MKRQFGNATVLITGAAGGLGRALCKSFAVRGGRIAALDRDEQAVAHLVSTLKSQGHDAIGIVSDVTDAAACNEAVARVSRELGRIDVLVNNAGITHRSGFRDTHPAVIRRVVEVNFFGSVNCTYAALPHLLSGRGMIIVIASVAGFAPLIARTGYAASKHALHGFFASLRSELAGDGVDVLLVFPSFVRTGIDKNALGADGGPAPQAQQIVGAQWQPEEVAERILSAASRGERMLLPGAMEKLAWWVSRMAPRLYDAIMARRLRGELWPRP